MLKRTSEPQDSFSPLEPVANGEAPGFSRGLDMRAYLQIARRRAHMIGAIALLIVFAAITYAQLLTPLYTAKVSLLLDPPAGNSRDTEEILAEAPINASTIESQMQLIQAAGMAQRVLARLKLITTEGLTSDRVAELNVQAVKKLQANIAVKRRGLSYVIDVVYTDPSPTVASQIANAYADEYLIDQLEAKYDATRRANAWLNDRLGDLRKQVEESERAVEVFKVEHNIVDTTAGKLTDQQVFRFNEHLIAARAETAQAAVGLEQLRSIVSRGGDPSAFADALQSQQLGNLNNKASDVRRELAELSFKYGSRHPSVRIARAQLNDIQRQISNITQFIVDATENRFQGAKKREESIEASLGELKGTFSTVSQAEIRLRELEREAGANRALYESFLSRFKVTSQAETRQIAESRIVERATVPSVPSAPNMKKFALVGLALGLALGAGLAFILEQLDSRIRTWDQVEAWIGVPVLASVPRADDQLATTVWQRLGGKLNLLSFWATRLRGGRVNSKSAGKKHASLIRLAVNRPRSGFTEAIRALRMGIRFASTDAHPRIVLVSSALPQEGKSTIASNLAFHSACSGERVLLIDMDLRHPALSMTLAPQAKAGLIQALEQGGWDEFLLKDEQTGLFFLPAPGCGRIKRSAEILGSERVGEFLRRAIEKFDLIVIDTSPLLPVTDSRMLMPAVDAFVMVAHWEQTDRQAIAAALRQSPGAQDKLVGVVLNDVVARRARHYDYYQSGYYIKKYPHYYNP
jgi:succinoglycan biosynthesis transport protein ExoP